MITLGESDAGRSHTVQVGDEVVVRLPENPTTGHRWHLTLPTEGLDAATDSFAAAAPARPGSGGTREFRLQASAPGTFRVGLAHKRSWEPTASAATVLEFDIHVVP